MKILKIRISNLNSLKGDWTIDFEQPPLSGSGIFAITGNTGAGKTTILDAITLGLFGQVPRLEDLKGEQKIAQIMSYGSLDAFAEVEFSAKGKCYRAKCHLHKAAKSGALQPIRRELALLPDGVILHTKFKDIDAAISELLGGLDYRRFTRSVLLAQGEFEQFLRGSEDRSEILERITDTSNYSAISKAAFERHKKERQQLDQLQNQLQEYRLLSPEQQEQMEVDMEQHRRIIHQLQLEQAEAKSLMEAWKQIYALRDTIAQRTELIGRQSQIFESRNEAWEQLHRYDKTLPLQDTLRRYLQQQTALVATQNDIAQNKLALEERGQELEKRQAAQQQLYADWQQIQTYYEQQSPVWAEATEQQQQLDQKTSRWKAVKKDADGIAQKLDGILKEIEEKDEAVKELDKQIKEVEIYLETNRHYAALLETENDVVLSLERYQEDRHQATQQQKVLKEEAAQQLQAQRKNNADVAQWEAQLQAKREELLRLQAQFQTECARLGLAPDVEQASQQLKTEIEKMQGQAKKLADLQQLLTQRQTFLDAYVQEAEEIEHLDCELQVLEKQYLNIEDALDMIQQRIGDLQQTLTDNDKLIEYRKVVYEEQKDRKGLEGHRALLEEGKECPLCFSTSHPFRCRTIDIDFSVQQAKKDWELARAGKEKTEKKLAEAEAYRKSLEKEQRQTRSAQFTIQQHLRNHQTQSNQTIEALRRLESVMHSMEGMLDFINSPKELLQTSLQTLLEQIAAYQTIEKAWALLPQQLYQIDKEQTRLQTELSKVQARDETYQQAHQHIRQQYTLLEAKIADIAQKSEVLLLHWHFDPARTTLQQAIDHLKTQRKYYRAHQERHLTLAVQTLPKLLERSQWLEQSRSERQAEQSQKESELNALQTEIMLLRREKQKLVGDQHPDTLRQNALQQLEKARRQHQENEKQILLEQTACRQHQEEQRKLRDKEIDMEQDIAAMSEQIKRTLEALGIGYDSIESFVGTLLPHEQAATLRQEHQQLQQQMIHLQQLQQQEQTDLAALEALPNVQQTPFSVAEEQAQQLHHKWLESHRAIAQLEQRQQEQIALQDRFAALQIAYANQEREVLRWAGLNQLIGAADGKAFRVFAQNINLQRLLQLANRYLRQFMNGRYRLEKRSDDGLELDIQDNLQANHQRPLHTLSGGETFLASLALALGLSDLASGNTKIESLFIDEGFGSLDNETLQIALVALKTLESQGKTIGIISHVEPLKNAIPTQIRVVKKGSGSSRIEIEA